MKRLRPFLSVTFPLVMMLLMFTIYLVVNKVVVSYQKNITNDYAIVVITNTPLSDIEKLADINVKEIEPLSRKKIIKSVQNNLSDTSISLLNKKLPYFYKIYLEQFPTTIKLEQIRKELTTIPNVKKIETFSNDHNKIYSLLILIQNIVFVLFSVVLILSILLLLKQIKIWFFEHSERISIIQLHGGSLLYASKPIIQIIVLSSFISSIVVSIILFFGITNIEKFIPSEILSFIPTVMSLEMEIFKIILLSLAIPMITFFGLLVKYKIK
jgi:cell division transport system permease protein